VNDDKFMKPQEKIPTVLFFALWIPQAVLRVLGPRILVVVRCIVIFRIIMGQDGGFQEDVEPKAEDQPRENSDQTNDTESAADMADTGAAESLEPRPDLQMVQQDRRGRTKTIWHLRIRARRAASKLLEDANWRVCRLPSSGPGSIEREMIETVRESEGLRGRLTS
jgi:hypothetical protein